MIALKHKWCIAILITFSMTVILPQGVGIKLPGGLPNLDLPRMAAICSILICLLYIPLNLKKFNFANFISIAPKNTYFLVLSAVLFEIFSSQSFGGGNSFIWLIGDSIQIYFLALSVLVVIQLEKVDISVPLNFFQIIGLILFAWLMVEVVMNTHVIWSRNLWSEHTVTYLHSLKRFTILPMGPYAYVQSLIYAICLFLGGGVFLKGKKGLIFLIFFVTACICSQMIAAIFACFFLIFFLAFRKRLKESFLIIFLCLVMSGFIYIQFQDRHFYSAFDHFNYAFDGGRGSIEYRLNNLIYLSKRLIEESKFLMGFGMGALRDPWRVVTDIYLPGYQLRTDPGSFFIWFFEGGIFLWLCIFFLLLNTLYFGLASTKYYEKYLFGGIMSFFVISFSSQSPYLWGQAILFIGILEYSVRSGWAHFK